MYFFIFFIKTSPISLLCIAASGYIYFATIPHAHTHTNVQVPEAPTRSEHVPTVVVAAAIRRETRAFNYGAMRVLVRVETTPAAGRQARARGGKNVFFGAERGTSIARDVVPYLHGVRTRII